MAIHQYRQPLPELGPDFDMVVIHNGERSFARKGLCVVKSMGRYIVESERRGCRVAGPFATEDEGVAAARQMIEEGHGW